MWSRIKTLAIANGLIVEPTFRLGHGMATTLLALGTAELIAMTIALIVGLSTSGLLWRSPTLIRWSRKDRNSGEDEENCSKLHID